MVLLIMMDCMWKLVGHVRGRLVEGCLIPSKSTCKTPESAASAAVQAAPAGSPASSWAWPFLKQDARSFAGPIMEMTGPHPVLFGRLSDTQVPAFGKFL